MTDSHWSLLLGSSMPVLHLEPEVKPTMDKVLQEQFVGSFVHVLWQYLIALRHVIFLSIVFIGCVMCIILSVDWGHSSNSIEKVQRKYTNPWQAWDIVFFTFLILSFVGYLKSLDFSFKILKLKMVKMYVVHSD